MRPIEFKNPKKPKIDPYLMGVFIGSGMNNEKLLTLCTPNEACAKEVAEELGADGYERDKDCPIYWHFLLPVTKRSILQTHFHTRQFFKDYPEVLGMSHERSIPNDFIYSSVRDRNRLLSGLIDSIGVLDDYKYFMRFSSLSVAVTDDIVDVLRSLGYNPTVEKKTARNYLGYVYEIYVENP